MLVVGAGPVGLMLATELRLAGTRVLVVERREEPDTAVKAGAVNTASALAFDRRGLLPALEAALRRSQPEAPRAAGSRRPPFVGHFGGIPVPADPVDRSDPDLRDRGRTGWYLMVPQVEVERVLGLRAAELGVEIRRGVEVRGFDADGAGVTAHLSGGDDVRAAWLVGCDGGHSLVRRLAGFEFTGTGPGITGRQAVVALEGGERLGQGWQHTPTGVYAHGPTPGRVRTVEFDGPPADRHAPVTAAEIEASLRRVSGVDVRVTEVISAARFTDNARQASDYRRGRVLLCGDAAHVHSPFSGQGLNLGLGDAVNLGWKLAATVRGWAPEGLLDTYTAERHPVGAWVLDWTRAQVAVMRGDADTRALRGVVADFLGTRDGATHYVKRVSGLWQRYDLGGGHPLVGATMPDLRLDDGTRLAEHAHGGRALLVDLAADDRLAAAAEPYAERLELIRGGSQGSGLSGLLVRPDGVVAWASADGDTAGLETALIRWLGTGTGRPG
ncbi:2-polyprenyl-6-methoxyphenol hydroxylase-like FAD-dependent oxidoreductase [Saccharothrix coeruleofusca]|uniref:FAD-dependent monooxygenase n=1 Tax=Saccharothrix coeruleofusca TaxID=33919 RepID=UPI001AE2B974|nr:FAD-dependent monooxygenase [Saccharothrix coeruleofusca]MBP2338897.1 2-polyprenyl-6-methoxyphenol hydroxylase-like FAD-dependent oxidoreductase [Saccharothrix coeruleofusca]